jgi:WXG100 family type VII secretion target
MRSLDVRVDFYDLENIARQLRRLSDDVQVVMSDLHRQQAVLQAGGWLGEAANAFYAEMDGILTTHLRKLIDELDDTEHGVGRVISLFEQADDTARAWFGSGGPAAFQPLAAAFGAIAGRSPNGSPPLTPLAAQFAGLADALAGFTSQGLANGSLTFTGVGGMLGSIDPFGGMMGGGLGAPSMMLGASSVFGTLGGVLQAQGIHLPASITDAMQGALGEPGIATLIMAGNLDTPEAQLLGNPLFQGALHALYNDPTAPFSYFELASVLDQAGFHQPAAQAYQAFVGLVNPSEGWMSMFITDAQQRLAELGAVP